MSKPDSDPRHTLHDGGADVPPPAPDVVPLPPSPDPLPPPGETPPRIIEPPFPGRHVPVREPVVPGVPMRY